MAIIGTVRQQPRDVEDYDIDFDEWFPVGDTIVQSSVSSVPIMPIPATSVISPNRRSLKVWVYEGGVSGVTYQLTIRASTNDGRAKEVELKVRIREV